MQPLLDFFFVLYDVNLVIAWENILIGLAQHPAEQQCNGMEMFICD